MVHLSRYWEMLRLDPGSQSCGYRCQPLTSALTFFRERFSEMDAIVEPISAGSTHSGIKALLFSLFRARSEDLTTIAKAGLCLRCYVSYPIVNACKRIARQFSASGRFTYQELLPFVLNDDGQSSIILDGDDKTQLVLTGEDTAPASFSIFSVEILRKFDPKSLTSMSLDGWVYYQTRQHPELKNFLAEQGLSYLSDWALLNRARAKQLETLAATERVLVEFFHSVYRRDRRHSHAIAARCPDPTPEQLQEMLEQLKRANISISSAQHLVNALKQIAKQLRQYEVWHRSGPAAQPLEHERTDSEFYPEVADPDVANTPDALEREEIRSLCHQQLIECLNQSICDVLQNRLAYLKQHSRYSVFASKFLLGLKLIYCEGMSQSEIATQLEMRNQATVSRVLDAKNLVKLARSQTVDRLAQNLLEVARDLVADESIGQPDYLQHFMDLVESFVDTEIFQEALAEVSAAKKRLFNSVFAQRLRHYIESPQEWQL